MRIVGGEWGGRILEAPVGRNTRPTSERVREAIFSIVQTRLPGAVVLDLFAGSGALGLEALSRGARLAVLVDSERKSIACIRRNIASLAAERARLLPCDALTALRQLAKEAAQNKNRPSCDHGLFTLVFLDPPYDSALYTEVLHAVVGIIEKQAWVVLECSVRGEMPSIPCGYSVRMNRIYGETRIMVLVWEGE